MTDFEFKYPRQVTAGSKAFLMGILRQNNPYRDKKTKDAWDRGYNAAWRKYEADKYRQKKEAEAEALAAGFPVKEFPKRRSKDAKGYRPDFKQIQRFNNKFRTVA